MNKNLVTIVIVLALVIVGFLLYKNFWGVALPTADTNLPAQENILDESNPVQEVTQTDPTKIKEFNVNAVPFSFTPSIMSVNVGDTVKITIKNVSGTHDLKIDEFGVASGLIPAGQSTTVTFVADKAGVFEYYCSVGNHRAMGMVGKLTVK